MNKLMLVVFLLFSLPAYSEVSIEDYCFSTSDAKPVHFELRTYYDGSAKWAGAFVKYEKSKSVLPLVLADNQVDILDKDRPAQLTRKWLEISDRVITGEYEMMSQGANIYSMNYTNYRKNKKFSFDFDSNAMISDGTGCKW